MAGKGHHKATRTLRQLLIGVVIAAAALLSLPSLASADYEPAPENFGPGGEAKEWLTEPRGMAVNTSGVGLPSDEAGSFYIALGGLNAVLRFSAGAEGEEPQFREAWGWGVGDGHAEYQRCGPALATEPAQSTFHTCKGLDRGFGGEEVGHFAAPGGVAVDQATGYVYVRNEIQANNREHHIIEVFTATGTPVGEGFGDSGRLTSPRETIAEGPEKLHNQYNWQVALGVDEAGNVYAVDSDFSGLGVARVMTFEPCAANDYESYCYAPGKDITTAYAQPVVSVAPVGSDRIVTASEALIREYPTGGASTPICTYQVPGGGVFVMTVNPVTGEVFYFSSRNERVHRLSACDEATGKFEELQAGVVASPPTGEIRSLAFNPGLAWGPLRPPGVLYAGDAENHIQAGVNGIGDVFVPAEATPPSVLSESVANTTATSSTLEAAVDPHGFGTNYHFQYLSEEAYEANEPDERQSLTVAASGGVFGLAFRGQGVGGTATGNLTAGSSAVTNLVTAAGMANVHAAKGTATLKAAVGTGTVISGSTKVTGVTASEGTFVAGQTFSITGGISEDVVPPGTTIVAASGTELTLSAPAIETLANAGLHAGTTELTAVATEEGVFEVGMLVEGAGISNGTTITAVSSTKLSLSTPVTKPGTGVAIKAGSTTLDGLSSSEGTFEVGQLIAGEGIPAGATITSVKPGALQISQAPTKPGTGIAISSPGPAPLAVGEVVEGPGIVSGTTIAAAEAGKLTLSQPATATGAGVQLRAGLPSDASAEETQNALEGLSTVGRGNVKVSGGPGDETGSRPYEVGFTGFPNQDLPELQADGSGLTGGPASAVVATTNDGGGGFSQGAIEVPVGGGEISGGGVGSASASISDLSPETHYRFRVVIASECRGSTLPACEVDGDVAAFATYPEAVATLPDRRAYELVSPTRKNGGEAFPAEPLVGSCIAGECKPPGSVITAVYPIQSTPDGSSVAYFGQPFSSSEGAIGVDSYVSSRTVGGWQTTTMSPTTGLNLTYDHELDEGIILQNVNLNVPLGPEAPVGYEDLYLQSTANPRDVRPLLTQAMLEALPSHEPRPPHRGPGTLRMEYGGHSPNYAAQYFAANDVLTEGTPDAPEPPDPGVEGRDLYEWRQGHLTLVNVLPGNGAAATGAAFASVSPDTHAISDDGSRVFWKAGGHLYVREGGTQTTEIEDPGRFVAASADGSRVLLDDGCLYDLAEEACEDLTQGHGGFLGIAGNSEDLSRIYFVDKAALAPGAETGTCVSAGSLGTQKQKEEEREGKVPAGLGCNLYVYEAGAGTSLIATLSASDGQGGPRNLADWVEVPGARTAEASPDGHYLAFASTMRLTGYDNKGLCAWEGTKENARDFHLVSALCKEVFLYDSITGRLTCPSCNPTEEAPLGNSTLRRIEAAKPSLPQPRYLSNTGRLFFDSGDRLSVLDANGRVEDVYEREPQGTGSCARASGCITLITPGSGSVDSNLLAVDEGGANVFFTSRERLAQQDTDELIDVYDAREGGGFPADTESQRVECQGESCQPVAQAPSAVTPASSVFHGAGNVKEAQQHKKKHHHKKKQHHKKKAKKARTAGHNRGGAK